MAEHLDIRADFLDGAHEAQPLTTTLKDQQLRPESSPYTHDLKAVPPIIHCNFPHIFNVNSNPPTSEDRELGVSAAFSAMI